MDKIYAFESNFILSYLDKRENTDIEAIKAALPNFEETQPSILTLNDDGAAVIAITGPLSRNGPGFFDMLFGFGGTSYNEIIESANLLVERPDIENVTIVGNSPGGEMDGLDDAYQALANLAKKKNVVGENHGVVASAAYYLLATCGKIKAMSPTAQSGSIGVVITGIERIDSEFDREIGRKRHMIISRNAPEKSGMQTSEGRDSLQKLADSLERVFFQRISEGRGVSIEKVKTDFGRGGVLIALDPDKEKPDALSVGMIDEVISKINDTSEVNRSPGSVDPETDSGEIKSKGETMGLTKLIAENPGLETHLEKVKTDAEAKGFTKGKAVVEARVTKASVYMGNESYPKPIQDLALKVIKGESDGSGLESAVAVYDSIKEQGNSEAAQNETDENGETSPEETPKLSTDGNIKNEADFNAEIAAEKSAMGLN